MNSHIRSGDSVWITCIATEGDLPITFLWTKDGSSTAILTGINIVQGNVYSSLLGIAETSSEHNGKYSCSASNSAGVVSTALQLEVHGNFQNASGSVSESSRVYIH